MAVQIKLAVPLKTKEQLHMEVDDFTQLLHETIKKYTPKLIKHLLGINYAKEILEKVAEKRKAQRIWQKIRYPSDKAILNRLITN